MLCKRFAKKCLKFDKSRDMFPLNENYMENVRNSEKFEVKFAKKGRLKESAIPMMQRLLNEI